MEEAAAAATANWSELHLDALALIISLLNLTDALSAAAACTSWRAAAATVLAGAVTPRRILWLLGLDSDQNSDAILFHDTCSGRSHRLPLPGPANSTSILGSSHGWLFASFEPERRLTLINPFTGARLPLPGLFDYAENLSGSSLEFWIQKFVLSGDPSQSETCYSVMLMHQFCKALLFARSGDNAWQFVKLTKLPCEDCISRGGMFLTVDAHGTVKEWDVNSAQWEKNHKVICSFPRRAYSRPGMSAVNFFLVATPWGGLLVVRRVDRIKMPTKFTVFAVDTARKTIKKTADLQGHALIIWKKHCSLVPADAHPAMKRNCVFFFLPLCTVKDIQAGVYKLKSQTFQPLPPSLEPSLNCKLQPMWIIPPSNCVHDIAKIARLLTVLAQKTVGGSHGGVNVG